METEEGQRALKKLNNRSPKYGSISNYLLAAVLDYQEKPIENQLRQIIREEFEHALRTETEKISEEKEEVMCKQREILEKAEICKDIGSYGFEDWELSDIPLE